MLFPAYEKLADPNLFTKLFYLATGYGHQAVMVFFVLSGFLVGGRVVERLRGETFVMSDYVIDRVSRLYPVYFACLILGGALDWAGQTWFPGSEIYNASPDKPVGVIGYDATTRLGADAFFINLFMLQGLLGPSFGSNGPLWSIAMEFWYYLTFPLLLLPLFTLSWRARLTYLIALAPVLYLLSLNLDFYVLFSVWLLGVIARVMKLPVRSMVFSFVLLIGFLLNARFEYGTPYIRDLLVGLGCMLVIAAALNGGVFPRFGWRFSKTLSDFSFSLYCFHFPIVALSLATLNFNVNKSTMPMMARYEIFVAVCLLCVATSFMLSRVTEAHTPAIRGFLKKRIPQAHLA